VTGCGRAWFQPCRKKANKLRALAPAGDATRGRPIRRRSLARLRARADETDAVVGIDGCRGGWVCLWVDLPTRETRVEIVTELTQLLNQPKHPNVVAIDIPIGLPDRVDRAVRTCDKVARRLLGWPRSSSVFPAPARQALNAEQYRDACRLNYQALGKRLSKQSFAILPKIRHVDTLISPEKQKWIVEVHPEVSFWELNGKQPLKNKKSSDAGAAERLKLLEPHYPSLRRYMLESASASTKREDILDAAVAAWSAERVARGQACSLGGEEIDGRGLRMEIAY